MVGKRKFELQIWYLDILIKWECPLYQEDVVSFNLGKVKINNLFEIGKVDNKKSALKKIMWIWNISSSTVSRILEATVTWLGAAISPQPTKPKKYS